MPQLPAVGAATIRPMAALSSETARARYRAPAALVFPQQPFHKLRAQPAAAHPLGEIKLLQLHRLATRLTAPVKHQQRIAHNLPLMLQNTAAQARLSPHQAVKGIQQLLIGDGKERSLPGIEISAHSKITILIFRHKSTNHHKSHSFPLDYVPVDSSGTTVITIWEASFVSTSPQTFT